MNTMTEKAIDLVIPMVFPQDKLWQKDFIDHKAGGVNVVSHVRFRSWNTEEMLIKCCIKYMPWVRRIYILLARESQVQPWMQELAGEPQGTDAELRNNGMPELRIVYHKEFIPAKYLPCFASPCIEMFLHHIPGLAEHFIYGNDDVFPLSPLEPSDFFRQAKPDGTGAEGRAEGETFGHERTLPCQHMTEKPYPVNPNCFQRKCLFQLNMIAGEFGKHYSKTWLKGGHSMSPLLKSSCEEVWKRHKATIVKNISPLQRNDRSLNHYIFSLYQHFAGLEVDYHPKQQYTGKSTSLTRLAEIISDDNAGIVCINDNETIDDWEHRAHVVRKTLVSKCNSAAKPLNTGRSVEHCP